MEILIKRLEERAKLPVYGREAGPGIDLYVMDETTIAAGEVKVLSTGIAMGMPVGYVGVICGPHSMIIADSIRVTVAILDSGYRDEIKIELTNTRAEAKTFRAGEKIAQILVHQVTRAHLIEAEDLDGEGEGN